MFKSRIIKESLIATGLMIFFAFLLNFIPIKFEFLKVLRQGFLGFDLYDLYYSGKQHKNLQRDSSILIVEIADTRESIAKQVNIINKYSPSLIGIDAIFEKEGDLFTDASLIQSIEEKSNVVLASRYIKDPSSEDAGFLYSYFDVGPAHANSGYINMLGNPYSVIRNYPPFLMYKDSTYLSFSSAIIKKYSKELFKRFSARGNPMEIIHYKGNLESYTSLSKDELLHYDSTGQLNGLLEGKIVLMGYFKKYPPLLMEDLHFSPLNEQVIGKSFPDIYGVVIHANILSMIIDGRYAKLVPEWVSFLLAGIMTFLFMSYLLSKHLNNRHPNHGYFLLLQFILLIVILYIFLQIFNFFSVKISLLPIMIALVLSVEFLGVYKMFALWLNRVFQYKTVFKQ
jgi:hypothetical protein